jgi:hypothetical protein
MAANRTKKAKVNAKAFINWGLANKEGKVVYRGDKGLPIFQNPEYPSEGEDKLIELAEANGGSIELTMKVTVRMNTPREETNTRSLMEDLGILAA